MADRNQMLGFTVTIIKMTDAGGMVVDHDGRTVCLPESQVEYDEAELAQAETNCNIEIDIQVPEWLAYEKEMI